MNHTEAPPHFPAHVATRIAATYTPPVAVTASPAPSYPLSAADKAAHEASSYVRRPLPARIPDSGLTAGGAKALGRLETWAAHGLRDRQTADAARREIAEVA